VVTLSEHARSLGFSSARIDHDPGEAKDGPTLDRGFEKRETGIVAVDHASDPDVVDVAEVGALDIQHGSLFHFWWWDTNLSFRHRNSLWRSPPT